MTTVEPLCPDGLLNLQERLKWPGLPCRFLRRKGKKGGEERRSGNGCLGTSACPLRRHLKMGTSERVQVPALPSDFLCTAVPSCARIWLARSQILFFFFVDTQQGYTFPLLWEFGVTTSCDFEWNGSDRISHQPELPSSLPFTVNLETTYQRWQRHNMKGPGSLNSALEKSPAV